MLCFYRLSDEGGKMEFTEVAAGKDINKSQFGSDDGIPFISLPLCTLIEFVFQFCCYCPIVSQ